MRSCGRFISQDISLRTECFAFPKLGLSWKSVGMSVHAVTVAFLTREDWRKLVRVPDGWKGRKTPLAKKITERKILIKPKMVTVYWLPWKNFSLSQLLFPETRKKHVFCADWLDLQRENYNTCFLRRYSLSVKSCSPYQFASNLVMV